MKKYSAVQARAQFLISGAKIKILTIVTLQEIVTVIDLAK